jgi:hypothetical protein
VLLVPQETLDKKFVGSTDAWFRTWRRRFKSTRPPTIISALDSQLTPHFRHATHAITMGINGGAE